MLCFDVEKARRLFHFVTSQDQSKVAVHSRLVGHARSCLSKHRDQFLRGEEQEKNGMTRGDQRRKHERIEKAKWRCCHATSCQKLLQTEL